MFAFAGYGVVGFGIMALEQWQEWPKGGEPAWTHSFGALFWAAFGAYQAVALTYQLFVTDPADPDRGHVLVRVSGRPGDAAAMTSSGHGGDRGRKPMRRILLLLIAVSMTAVLATPAAAAEPTITFENPPTGGVLELAVGETHVFDVTVTSDESFVLAIALTDQFYPGRGVFFAGSDRETQSTSADLHLTIRGKEPTDFLPDGVAWRLAAVAGGDDRCVDADRRLLRRRHDHHGRGHRVPSGRLPASPSPRPWPLPHDDDDASRHHGVRRRLDAAGRVPTAVDPQPHGRNRPSEGLPELRDVASHGAGHRGRGHPHGRGGRGRRA